MSRDTTLGTGTRSRCSVAAAAAVVAVAAMLVLPGTAHAAYRHRAESGYDTTSSKSVTATCGPGEELIGAGGRIRNGNGGVRLAAIVPGTTSVVVRGEAYPGHAEPWSVIAAAICAPDDGTPRVVEVSPAGGPPVARRTWCSAAPGSTCPPGCRWPDWSPTPTARA
ncbi:hypothetical protein [Verrucosispora sioxanthis]|uniref:hypothetical protein n=1 Tax=Verrucosispora sioxanthis TaxID=2499994 RepID=UPI001C11CFDD|nr:hypothetical protein [Verrucosispora sioxanthis]